MTSFIHQTITICWHLPTKLFPNSLNTNFLLVVQPLYFMPLQVLFHTYKICRTFVILQQCFCCSSGGSGDWAKSIGIKYSYTFELADTGANGFTLPASQILPVGQDFFPALDVFATQVSAATTTTARVTTSKPTTKLPTATSKKPTITPCRCTCPQMETKLERYSSL